MKNPNPGFATERQVRYIVRLLEAAGWSITERQRETMLGWSQEGMQRATEKAEHLKAAHTGLPLPSWIKS